MLYYINTVVINRYERKGSGEIQTHQVDSA